MKKLILLLVLSLTTLVGCQSPFGVDDAELLYESSRVIVQEYNQFLRGERTLNSYTTEELLIKLRRNDEYLKFTKALYEEAKEEQARLDELEEQRQEEIEARKAAERQEVLLILQRQLLQAKEAGDEEEAARLQGLIDALMGNTDEALVPDPEGGFTGLDETEETPAEDPVEETPTEDPVEETPTETPTEDSE